MFSTARGYSQQQRGGKETEDNNSRYLLIFYWIWKPENIKKYFPSVLLFPEVWLLLIVQGGGEKLQWSLV